MKRFDYVVVGAGFSGSVCAERLASAGFSVLVLEQRDHVGGNAFDRVDAAGVRIHQYGAHVFHTNSQVVFEYLSRFTQWRSYEHRVVSAVGDRFVPFPINLATVAAFSAPGRSAAEALALAKAALIVPYTAKQWGPYAEQLEASVLARVPARASWEDRYFLDRFQAMPADGYAALFARLLAHPGIEVMLRTEWQAVRAALEVESPDAQLVFTGPLDEFFEQRFGPLPYRSAAFEFRTVWDVPAGTSVLPAAVVNVPDPAVPYTRVAEFPQLTGQKTAHSTICYEYPMAAGEPFWPVPTAESRVLADRYREAAAGLSRVHFCGRLGSYRYLNMDQAVAQALVLSQRLVATARVEGSV